MSVKDFTTLGCSSQQPTRRRNHNAYLLRWQQKGFLFDPGEGTQRQFIFAGVSPTCVTHIFISHFHGDHCLGLPSMLMRLNLDKINHPVHLIFPESGRRYLDRLRFCAIYQDHLEVILHPVTQDGLFMEDDDFFYYTYKLDHGIDCYGYRIEEKEKRRFDPIKLSERGIRGLAMKELISTGQITLGGKTTKIDEVSFFEKGEIFGFALDTKECPSLHQIAADADLFVCESTYLDAEKELAKEYRHMTVKQAATIAKESNVKALILTHFSARHTQMDLLEQEAKAIFPNTFLAEDGKQIPFGS